MGRSNKRLCTALLLLCIVLTTLSAQFSLGVEFGLLGTTGIAVQYEQQRFRSEVVTHIFLLDLLSAPCKGDLLHTIQQSSCIGKAILSARCTPTERHVLYGGIGMLAYLNPYYGEYMVGIGPALQYAWKFPSKQRELHVDLLLPLVFTHNYEEEPVDDWPSTAAFVSIALIAMAPTIGFSWSF